MGGIEVVLLGYKWKRGGTTGIRVEERWYCWDTSGREVVLLGYEWKRCGTTGIRVEERSQPTTFDHINIKYIWGPHVNHMGTHNT